MVFITSQATCSTKARVWNDEAYSVPTLHGLARLVHDGAPKLDFV